MLSETLKQYVFVVRKLRCGCTIAVAPIQLDVFVLLEEYILDPDYEIELRSASQRRKLGCDHEDQP